MTKSLVRAATGLALSLLICGLIACGSSSSEQQQQAPPPPPPPPNLTQDAAANVSLSPNTGAAGTTVTVTITGDRTNFVAGSTTASVGPGTSVGSGGDA